MSYLAPGLMADGVIPGEYEIIITSSVGTGSSAIFTIFANTTSLNVTYPNASLINSTVTNTTFLVTWTPNDLGATEVEVFLNHTVGPTSTLIFLGFVPDTGSAIFNLSELVPSIIPSSGWTVDVSSLFYGEGQSSPPFTFIAPPNISISVPVTTVTENTYINITWIPFNPDFGSGVANISIVNSTNTSQVIYTIQVPDTGNASIFINGSVLTLPGNYSIQIVSAYGEGTSAPILVVPVTPVFPVKAIVGRARVGFPFVIDYQTFAPLHTLSFRLLSFGKTSVSINAPASHTPTKGREILFIPRGFQKGPAFLYIIADGVESTPIFVTVLKYRRCTT